jgi:retron-type reverse transcriptase
MKSYKHLYQEICAFENLFWAYCGARRGKRSATAVAGFEYREGENLLALQSDLLAKTYQPGAYRHFYIHEPKRRKISAAPFRDRVVHHALCNIIEPIFERLFIHDSYACRIGKGTHRALDRGQEFAREHRYVLQADVQQFFPSIDHACLRAMLAARIRDAETLALIDRILASGVGIHTDEYAMQWFPGDDLFAVNRPRGLPIGNLTSQFWANVYLNELDQFVKRELKCRAYARYVDDFVLFADDKPTLHAWRAEIIAFLHTLRLRLHEPQCRVFPVTEGIPFLGFKIFPTHRRLKRAKALAFRRRFKRVLREYAAGEIELARVDAVARGWINHASHGDTDGLRRALWRECLIPARTG